MVHALTSSLIYVKHIPDGPNILAVLTSVRLTNATFLIMCQVITKRTCLVSVTISKRSYLFIPQAYTLFSILLIFYKHDSSSRIDEWAVVR